MKKNFLVSLLTVVVILTGCYKTYVDDSASSGTTRVFMHVDWDNNLHTGDTEPTNYTLFLNNTEYAISANPVDTLLPAGQDQELLVYNNPMGMVVSNGVATLAEATRVATDPEQHPDNLYYGKAVADLMAGTQSDITIPTKRGTAPLTVKVAYDMSKVGEIQGDIIATLSGVAATRNMITDSLSDAVDFATTVTLDATASEFVMTFNILGVTGNQQVVTFDIVRTSGIPATLTADITDALKDFNANMEPLEVNATLRIPTAEWLLSEITSTHYPEGTDWTIESDNENPALAEFDSLRHVLLNLITTDGSINLTLTKAVTIPDGSGSYPNATGAFANCMSLNSISLPDATSLGLNALINSSSLTGVNAPNVTTIGGYAFNRCSMLNNVTLGDITEIPEGVFGNCRALTSLDLPSVTTIGQAAFSGCHSLSSITFGDITKIADFGFSNCFALTSLYLPEVDSVGRIAFANCTKLESITLGKATKIGSSTFTGCTALTTLNIGTKVTTLPADADIIIDQFAFSSAPIVNITLTVGYGRGDGPTGNMNWTAKTGLVFTRFKEVIAPNTIKWLLSEITSTNYPIGTDWRIEADTETPTLANFDSLRHVLSSVITTTGSIDLTLTNATTIPDGSGSSSDGTGAFFDCDALKSISMPQATSLGVNALYSCSYLTEVNAPNVTEIGEAVFGSCSSLTNVNLGDITEIPEDAYRFCSALTKANYPNVTKIGIAAFRDCHMLNSITLGDITKIPGEVFGNCSSLTSIDFPEVDSVGTSAFINCAKLTSISLGKATVIEESAFDGCSALTTMNIGTGYTNATAPAAPNINISSLAFGNAPKGKITLTVGYGGSSGTSPNMTWTAKTGSEFAGFKEVVPPTWLLSEITPTRYPAGTNWTIETDTQTPAYANFDNLKNVLTDNADLTDGSVNLTLTKVTATPDGPNAEILTAQGILSDCSELKSVSLPEATTIGSSTFSNSEFITDVNAPNVTTIGKVAFNGCSRLSNVNIGNITKIPFAAFSNCTSLTTANFPSVTTLDGSAFISCSALTEVNFPLVTKISEYAFSGCSNLNSLTFGDIQWIDAAAFEGCSSLTSLDFPGVTIVGSLAFEGCTSLTTITLGKATTVLTEAFSGCTALTTLNIGTALTAAPTEATINVVNDPANSAFGGAPVGNITLTVGYGSASGISPDMTWTPETGIDFTGFKSVVEDFNY